MAGSCFPSGKKGIAEREMAVLDVLPKAMLPILLGKRHAPRGEKPSLKSGDFMQPSPSEDVINADCCPHFSGGSLAPSSTAVSEPTPASLKGTGGKANILQTLYYLLSADAIFNFY